MGKHALLIGVGEYGEGLQPLPAAPNDVSALKAVLQNPNMGRFDEVKTVINPTQAEMSREIELWFSRREPDDLILLFFSGHGVKDERRDLYLAAHDTEKQRDRLVRATATSARFVSECIRSCKAKYLVVILDCCFSGAFGDMVARDDGTVDLQDQLGAEGRVVLTSTSAVDYSFEEKGSNLSIYTRYLVEGIASGAADEDGDGVITVEELHHYAGCKVEKASPAMSPKIITLKDEGYRIQLARSPQDDPKLKYRKQAERRADAGQFSLPARRLLNILRLELGVSEVEAQAIEAEVLEPYQEYQRKRQEYQDTLQQCLQEEATLSPRTIRDLMDLRAHLNLKQEDVIFIEQIALAGNCLAEYATAIERQRQYFEFEIIKVNERGETWKRCNGQAEYRREDLGNGMTLDLVQIPVGSFLMGSPADEVGRDRYGNFDERLKTVNVEGPQHSMMVQSILIGKYPVTQAQWKAVAALPKVDRDLCLDPSTFKEGNRPVEQVSWEEAIEFCQRLSRKTGREYRLPSEAEWEYACRAGTTTPFHFGETITADLVNYNGNYTYGSGPKGQSRGETTEVGSFKVANAFGLYDMCGNIWEWCLDHWHESYEGAPIDGSAWTIGGDNQYRLVRGGSWFNSPDVCRSANRNRHNLGSRRSYLGFRVVCSSTWTL